MALNRINVVYITDQTYAMPTCVSAYSLISSQAPETQLEIYLIVNDINDNSKERFKALTNEKANIHIIEVSNSSYSEMAKSCLAYKTIHVSYTALFKFDLPQLLPQIDKVLYIDGDTLIQKSLLELYNMPLEEYYVAAVDDIIEKQRKISPINMGTEYFNSGVMLLNLKKMREDAVTEKLIDYRIHGINSFMDQDALNAVLGRKKLSLPCIWNFLTTLLDNFDIYEISMLPGFEETDDTGDLIEQIAILHCADQRKPWNYYMPWLTDCFLRYYKNSPYADEKLELLNPLKEQRLETQRLRNQIDDLSHRLHAKGVAWLQPYEERIQGKRIAVYGAGRRGQAIRAGLDRLCTVALWVDENHKSLVESGDEKLQKVQSPEALKTAEFDCVLIAVVNQQILSEIKKKLIKEMEISPERIVTLYDRRSEDKIAQEVSELYRKWKGKEHALALSYTGKLSNAACAPCVKNIGMMYRWMVIGGLQRVMSMLAFLFHEMGYHVTIILDTREEIAYKLPPEVEVVTICEESGVQSTGSYLQRGKDLRRVIREKRIDTIIYHSASSPILLYDLLLCKKSSVYFVAMKHEMFSQYMAYRSDTLYRQQTTFRLLDRLVTLGQDENNFWEVQGVKATYISNPTGEYATSGERTGTGKYILWLGRLARMQKQCMDVVPIMQEVVKSVPDAVMKIYGNEIAPGIINELKTRIEKCHLEDNIKYCGYVTGNVGEIYRDASVFLVTSEYESFPLTIYESKLNGVPLVTYQMPYLELLKNGLGYIAVENDNTEQAAAAIVSILQDKALGERLSEEAKASVAEFGNGRVKEGWKQLFNTLPEKSEVQKKSYSAEEMNVLLETMMYHYHKGLQNGGNEAAPQTEGLAAVVKHYCQQTMLPPVIYPFGTVGKRVQKILKEQLHIQEAFVVDNHLSEDHPDIKSAEDLKKIDCSKYIFFICCKIPKQHDEIMKSIRDIVPERNIVDLYPC